MLLGGQSCSVLLHRFLNVLLPDASSYLRGIIIKFPIVHKRIFEIGSPQFDTWLNGIEKLAHDFKLAQLELTTGFFTNDWIARKQSDADIWGNYQRILQPLDKLNGLKDLLFT